MLLIDTLNFSKKLTSAGFTEKQAEVLIEFQSEAIEEAADNKLATKKDLLELRSDFKNEISQTKSTLIQWMVGLFITLLITQFGLSLTIIQFLSK